MTRVPLIIFFFFYAHVQAQILKPASWSFTSEKTQVEINDHVDLIFNVKIDDDWYLYSTDFDPELGPMVTDFNFEPHESFELIGGVKPINPKKKYDEIWEGEISYFEGKAQFRQTVKILKKNLQLKGTVEYQVCTDVDGKCIPFEEEYTFEGIEVVTSKSTVPQEKVNEDANATGGSPAVPVEEIEDIKEEVEEEIQTVEQDQTGNVNSEEQISPKKELPGSLSSLPDNDPYSLASFMVLAFLAGLAALVTPCVFPMIPMTVSFFTSTNKNRRKAILMALFYGFSIIAIYTLAGTLVSRLNGPEFVNWLSTHWVPNLLFFTIFIIFGLSFLGLFEITLPSSLINKVDREADKGGYYGTFFMAFTIVLVSFSCTGPIVGSLLVESAGGAIVKPIAGMFAYSLAFAIPFTLFAIFPDWLSNLPKSGGWLNSVKVVLGFLELALALKFLSIADQVYHWKLLDRDVFLAIWIAIFSFLGFYLLGKIRLPHDGEAKPIGVPRLILALVTFSFIVYLVPGLFGAPLKSLAGFLPPISSQDFNVLSASSGHQDRDYELCDEPKYSELFEFPHGIKGYFDLDQALSCAKQQNKPVFIDFTGHGCVNCREMEVRVWSDPEVLKRLKEDFVMVALYVDEKKDLPKSDWYTSTFDGRIKKTLGSKNADFQITQFENNAQPFYVILDADGKELIEPIAYEKDISQFIRFLDTAKSNFKKTL